MDVSSPTSIDERMEVVRRRDKFEADPEDFARRWRSRDGRLRSQISKAKDALDKTDVPDRTLRLASTLCVNLGVDGLRGELTLIRAARARAALDGRNTATTDDIASMATAALAHRLRRDPLDESGSGVRVQRALAEAMEESAVD